MEFPFGHHGHHHHNHPPPPPPDEEEEFPPPPRPQHHIPPLERPYTEPPVYYPPPGENIYERPPPPSQSYYKNYPDLPQELPNYPSPPQPGYSTVHRISHESNPEYRHDSTEYRREEEEKQQQQPHHGHNPFSFIHHHRHEGGSETVSNEKKTVRVFCRADENYSLSVRNGKVILARADPNDQSQHWIKDETFSTRVKDEESFPSFALINKATGQVMKHSIGATYPVQLWAYNPDVLDESVLWTESRDTGDGFRAIRMINNIRLNLDAFHGDKNHGGVRDGTEAVLWEWKKGDNQKWKIVPYCKFLRYHIS